MESVCVSDDVEPNSVASIPGMGIPEQLKAAMEQEQSSEWPPLVGVGEGLCPRNVACRCFLFENQSKQEDVFY